MKDIEGNDLILNNYYIVPSNSSSLCIAKFTHETENSYMFYPIDKSIHPIQRLYSWRRQIAKWHVQTNIPVVPASQTLLDNLGL